MTETAEATVQSVESTETRPWSDRDSRAEENAAIAAPSVDPDAPEWYLNRELTWLAFNRRVL
ncbi:MAG: hypothetical protein RKP73_13520, partial [Candidatus Contendobacter sp.]|nr:hypothetical protein [Candidatus Contendobacter sp.]